MIVLYIVLAVIFYAFIGVFVFRFIERYLMEDDWTIWDDASFAISIFWPFSIVVLPIALISNTIIKITYKLICRVF